MKLVLVDIDGTLVTAPSSERRFASHLREQGRIGLRENLSFAWFALRYFPIFGTGVLRKNKAYLAGIPKDEVKDLANEFVADRLAHALYEPACARLRHHLQVGDEVWLLSGTLSYIAASLASLLRLEHVRATECVVVGDKLAARPPTVHPYGHEKLAIAEQLCRERGFAMTEVVAYADSWADRHLMEKVGTAVAVMPDQKLAQLAVREGWEVLAAGSTEPAIGRGT